MMVDSYDSLDIANRTNLYMCMFLYAHLSLSVPLLLSPLCGSYFLVVDYYNTYGDLI
jgi:hypothetical protein